MPPERALSTLLVAVPEAEAVVAAHRLRMDPSAAAGVPAHVTVLFPFVPAADLDEGRSAGSRCRRRRPAFRYRFARMAWFDDRVLYLAPDDDAPFRELTDRVHAEFPDFPPFEGLFDDVVPHLTVGQDQPLDVLKQAEKGVESRLPIEGRATQVVLLVQDAPGGRWQRTSELPAQPPVIVSTSSCAVDVDSNSAPTWSRVPRSGSIVGIRTRFSRPRSNTTESHDAAATCAG